MILIDWPGGVPTAMPDATIAIDVPSATKSATKRTGSCGSHLKGGTVFDVFLTTTAAAVGQSILALPTTLSWMGGVQGHRVVPLGA